MESEEHAGEYNLFAVVNEKDCGLMLLFCNRGLLLTALFVVIAATLLSLYFYFSENGINRPRSPDYDLKPPTISPTLAPSLEDQWVRIMDRIGDTIVMDMDMNIFDDTSTTQHKAFSWLVYDDSYQSGQIWRLPNKELVERYALAVVYFESLGRTWNRPLNFLEPVSVCEWNNGVSSQDENAEGVYCSEETVTYIQLGMYFVECRC